MAEQVDSGHGCSAASAFASRLFRPYRGLASQPKSSHSPKRQCSGVAALALRSTATCRLVGAYGATRDNNPSRVLSLRLLSAHACRKSACQAIQKLVIQHAWYRRFSAHVHPW
jgi:hypothetical protein